jgi:hypothetical protein
MAVVVLAAWLNVWPSFPLDLSYLQLIFVPLLFGFPPSASHRLHFFSFTLPISNPTSNGWRHRKDGATGRQAGGDASYTREGLRSQRTLVPDQARLHSSVRAVATRLAAAPESLKGEQETQSVTSEELAGGCTRTER